MLQRRNAGPVLVTGASGFIGNRLVTRLASEGIEVRATSRSRPDELPPGVEFVPADLADADSHRRLTSGVRLVINVAGQLGYAGIPEQALRQANTVGPAGLVDASAEAGVERFVHVSTVGVLGATGSTPAAEDAPAHPVTPYERTKAEGERKVLERARQAGPPAIALRPALVYGPGDRHVLPLFRASRHPMFFFVDGGRAVTHPVYVDDVVEALMRAAFGPLPRDRVFHVAGETPVCYRDFVGAICRAMDRRPPRLSVPAFMLRPLARPMEAAASYIGRKSPLTRQRLQALITSRAFDITRARAQLDWSPAVGLDEGLRRTVGWYRDRGLL